VSKTSTTSMTSIPLLVATAFLAGCGDAADAPETRTVVEAAPRPTFPLDPDIWLAPLSHTADGGLEVGVPTAAIHRPGYDNQPHFTPDGSGFWFTAFEEHTGQTDIWRFDLDGGFEQVTVSAPESEYSATPIPDGSGISVIRVEADSTQRLWRIRLDGSPPSLLLPNVAPVGYHAWLDATTVALFVLGEPPTLQIATLDGATPRTVARGIGRALQSIPGTRAISFIQQEPNGAVLMRYQGDTGTVSRLVEAVPGGEFHAWTPDGRVLMTAGSAIYIWDPAVGGAWTQVGDLSDHNVVVTRIAVSPDGSRIALVVEPGEVTL